MRPPGARLQRREEKRREVTESWRIATFKCAKRGKGSSERV